METDNLYINNALDWLKRAVDSLVSHKRTDEGTGFIRSSKQIIPEQKRRYLLYRYLPSLLRLVGKCGDL